MHVMQLLRRTLHRQLAEEADMLAQDRRLLKQYISSDSIEVDGNVLDARCVLLPLKEAEKWVRIVHHDICSVACRHAC